MKTLKKHTMAIMAILVMGTSSIVSAQLTVPATSPEAEITQRVGITDITIHYNRPSVKGRTIWGNLVPYGFNDLGFGTSKSAPWRAGADMNTTIEFSTDVKLEGTAVKAGTYALFMSVEEDGGVEVILSSNTTSWGSYYYDESENVARVKVTSKALTPSAEMLTFDFDTVTQDTATASLKWGTKEIPFNISVDVKGTVLAGIKNDLRNANGFQQSTWDQAATYAFGAGETEQALEWVNASISGQFFSKETFANLSLKSQILNKMGKKAEATEMLNKSIPLGTVRQVYGAGAALLTSGDANMALEVMKKNVKNHDGAFPSNYGLARAYSAKGDFKNAIKSIEASMKSAPESFKGRLEQSLARLKKGEDINK